MSTRRADYLPAGLPDGGDGHRPVVCVADPDPAVRERVRALLGVIGADVRGFSDGAELLAALIDPAGQGLPLPIACIVADARLQGLPGLALLDELRRRGLRIPTILLSAEADVTTAVGAMRAGALDFIEKPYVDRALLNQVAPLLRLDDRPT